MSPACCKLFKWFSGEILSLLNFFNCSKQIIQMIKKTVETESRIVVLISFLINLPHSKLLVNYISSDLFKKACNRS